MWWKRPTGTQLAVLRYLWVYRGQHGWWPNMRDVMRNFGCTSSRALAYHYDSLKHKGLLERKFWGARALRPAGETRDGRALVLFPSKCPDCGSEIYSGAKCQHFGGRRKAA